MSASLAWTYALSGLVVVVVSAWVIIGVYRRTRGPLPALDRTSRSARVIVNGEDVDGDQILRVEYEGADGAPHEAQLADVVHDSWVQRFAPGTQWQVYAFRDAPFADTVVFLTEAHDDVWRDGFRLDGVRLGGESGPVKPGPRSPFLHDDSRWKFEA